MATSLVSMATERNPLPHIMKEYNAPQKMQKYKQQELVRHKIPDLDFS